ncbi:hypothetical protein BDD12DRAFT_235309 [Trichophaea hybrida]|nr:hypothetical protein BDD12DRAFT_235309 [Trichophaea hybrida]
MSSRKRRKSPSVVLLLLLWFVAAISAQATLQATPPCHDIYDACMSAFRECLQSVASLAAPCEEYRGNMCEGVIRVQCEDGDYLGDEETTSMYTDITGGNPTKARPTAPATSSTMMSSNTTPASPLTSTVYLVFPVPDSSTTLARSPRPSLREPIVANSTTTAAAKGLRLGLQNSAGVKVDIGGLFGWVVVCMIAGVAAEL